MAAFLRLSGPGWLQSAITLGGGSLGSALYLGVLGGSQLLWVQVVAVLIGVVMLSAIAYVTLSTRIRPYHAINQYVNPVLGIGWILATILANMIWIMPQYSLCFDALHNNIWPQQIDDSQKTQLLVSVILGVVALIAVVMSFRPGWMSRIFDLCLKIVVGLIVACFVWAIVFLTRQGELNWSEIWTGFIPKLENWNQPAPDIANLIGNLPEQWQQFWSDRIVGSQQKVIISAAATAVGINMTFLLPYSMIARGWDKPFRGLARFDLITAMAIPFMLVTSCIVLASAHSLHGKVDESFLSDDATTIMQSRSFTDDATKHLQARYLEENGEDSLNEFVTKADDLDDEKAIKDKRKKEKLAAYAATLSKDERRVISTLIKPNTSQLADSLKPVLGENANLIFGLGAFAMGFSTMIILMMINGYAVAEVLGNYENTACRTFGALLAGIVGVFWILIWKGQAKTWVIIVASSFGAMLLPIAYFAFLLLMNNERLLGDAKPRGLKMVIWNVLMSIGVAGAVLNAYPALSGELAKPESGKIVLGALITFGAFVLLGFSARFTGRTTVER